MSWRRLRYADLMRVEGSMGFSFVTSRRENIVVMWLQVCHHNISIVYNNLDIPRVRHHPILRAVGRLSR